MKRSISGAHAPETHLLSGAQTRPSRPPPLACAGRRASVFPWCRSWILLLLSGALLRPTSAATLHVWVDSPAPAAPFAGWDSAARVLQEALDAAQPGDTVVVTNGIYNTGGRVVQGNILNRAAVPPGVRVESVGGPEVTIIEGAPRIVPPGGPPPGTVGRNDLGNGDGAMRCAFLARDAVLAGFTLRYGHTLTNGAYDLDQSGGGVWGDAGARAIGCLLTNNAAHHMGGAAFGIGLEECRILGNRARYGAGVCLATASDSVLTSNSAENGGGAYMSRLTRCTIADNDSNMGGGMMGGAMLECSVRGNTAGQWGGGLYQVTAQKCRIEQNEAERGGGAFISTLFACVVTANTGDLGGGAAGGTLRHCTVTGNTGGYGGGVYLSDVHHSIVYFNDAVIGPNHDGSTFAHSCTTPLPDSGTGNITEDPQLASDSHLSESSTAQALDEIPPDLGTDIDGEPWQQPSSMGCDQRIPGQTAGDLTVEIRGGATTVAVGYPVEWRAIIRGRTSASEWTFGDGQTARNQPILHHTWTQPGTYVLSLTAYNDSYPDGTLTNLTVTVVEPPILHVAADSTQATPPFATWQSAATTIQAAIDAAVVPGSVVLVTNGVYNRGGAYLPGDILFNRVAVTRPVVVRSVNGPSTTFIAGAGPLSDFAVRCVHVGRDAVLEGFTLTNGYTRTLGARLREQRGGGVSGEARSLVTNCVLAGNTARQFGGGANRGTLRNCVILRNNSFDGAGGAYESVLEDCTLDRNHAANTGGAASRSLLSHCRIVGNSAPLGAGTYFGTIDDCRLEANVTTGDGYGGGANGSLLRNCVLTNNTAYSGGGACSATLERCRLEGNTARRDGGGATESTLTDCTLVANTATYGGGASSSILTGCDLTGNRANVAGGGADGGTLERCTLSGNSAFYGGATQNTTASRCSFRDNTASAGGASHADSLVNCLFTGNSATNQGGATSRSRLLHCTVSGNRATSGGGLAESSATNSIVYYNTAPIGSDSFNSTFVASCLGSLESPTDGNRTNPPAFLHPESGDYRLRGDSPCIDTALLLDPALTEDFNGALRPLDGNGDHVPTPDLGAFEYDPETTDSNGDGIPDSWYLQYGLNPADPDVGAGNPDGDSLTTYEEWIADTNPSDSNSDFSISVSNRPPLTVLVSSVKNRTYTLRVRPDVDPDNPSDTTWTAVPGQESIQGTGETLALADTNSLIAGYYRVEVRLAESNRTVRSSVSLARRGSRPASQRSAPQPFAGPWPFEEVSESSALLTGLLGLPTTIRENPRPPVDLGAAEDSTTPWTLAASTRATRATRATLQALPRAASTNAPHRFRIPTGSEIAISPLLRGQEPFMLYAQSARQATLDWARGATIRGVAGGTDAETYNWKDLSSQSRPHQWSYHVDDPPVVTTLEWLEQARDYQLEPVFTVNTRGHGRWVDSPAGRRTWFIDPASNGADYLAPLAADWVRYANLIAPNYRLTPEGQLPPDLATTDPAAARLLDELRVLGNGTNAWHYRLATTADPDTEVDPWLERPLLSPADARAATRPVKYWEIGNEVETSLAITDDRSSRRVDSAIDLSPAQYVERYLRMTEAMKSVDPTIRVGPAPNNPWGPHAGVENQHLIQLLARPDAIVDVLYFHYYMIWAGTYYLPPDVNRNLRTLKNHGYLLHTQYAAQFARAGRSFPPVIVTEWNPDYTIHPPVERSLLSALATAEVFFTFVELQLLGAHYWENPESRASRFVFDRLATHLGDQFLGSSYGRRADDGSYTSFGEHPSASTDVRIYATRRTSDSKVFVWMLNLSDTATHTIEWEHPLPVAEARTHVLRDPSQASTYYTPEHQLAWVSEPTRTNQPTSTLLPASISILELTYATPPPPPSSAPVVRGLVPNHGPLGSEVLIHGEGFASSTNANIVHFGAGRASVLRASTSNLVVRVPASATYGLVSVTVTPAGRTGWSDLPFTPAFAPGTNEPILADSLVPLPQRVYPPEGVPIVTAPIEVLLGDWREEGQLQLASLSSRTGSVLPDTIDLFPNASVPGFPAFSTPFCDPQAPLCSLPLNSSPARVQTADLDGDGRLDLACIDRHAWHVAVWRNAQPDPERSFDIMGLLPTGRSPSSLAIHDLDRDGRPDLLVTQTTDGTLGVLRNLTTTPGTLAFATNQTFRPADPKQMLEPHALVVGDLLGNDGIPEVVVASRSSGRLTLFENTSTPGNLRLAPWPSPIFDHLESVVLGDVDGDQRLDIVGTGPWPEGGVIVQRNLGKGEFERLSLSTSRDLRQVCLADINGDGRPDILTVNNDTVSISVFRNRSEPGSLAFDARQDFPIPGMFSNDPVCLTAGDIDGDGKPDVAVGHYYSGVITLLHNRSN